MVLSVLFGRKAASPQPHYDPLCFKKKCSKFKQLQDTEKTLLRKSELVLHSNVQIPKTDQFTSPELIEQHKEAWGHQNYNVSPGPGGDWEPLSQPCLATLVRAWLNLQRDPSRLQLQSNTLALRFMSGVRDSSATINKTLRCRFY